MGRIAQGTGVSAGIAFGTALVLPPPSDIDANLRIKPADVANQQSAFNSACQSLISQLTPLLEQFEESSPQGQLIEAELMLLEDEEFADAVHQAISTLRLPAHLAVDSIVQQHADELEALEDEYLAARAKDILSLGQRLVRQLRGEQLPDLNALERDTILIARDMTPAEFAALPMKSIKGLVLIEGGLTSHTAILARAAGIPALLSCRIEPGEVSSGDSVILNANEQTLHISPSTNTISKLKKSLAQFQARQDALAELIDKECVTRDGTPVPLMANVGCKADIDQLLALNGAGVGLLRTELMLLNAKQLPDEEEQYKAYMDCLLQLDGKPFTVRTMDIGADKVLAVLKLPKEPNPALGLRGIRYSYTHPDLFRSQLRALLRVANHGPVRLMFPMINQVEELDWVLTELESCRQLLLQREQGYGEIALGIVVETPAAALNLESMLPELDFISIGTNDLTQYTMAADRMQPEITRAFPTLSPPLLRLIKHCIDAAHQYGLPVSMCGELAGNPQATALLLGLGLDEFSLSPSGLLEVKAKVLEIDMEAAGLIAEKALKCRRLDELKACIAPVNSPSD